MNKQSFATSQKGLSQILIIILVFVGLFAVGQIIYSFNLLPIKPTAINYKSISPTASPQDLTCQTKPNFSLSYPKEVTAIYKKIYDNDPTCFYTLKGSNFTIFIAPAGKYTDWGGYGSITTKKLYSVTIGDQIATDYEIDSINGASNVILKGIKGYDFGITFANSDSKKQVADILKTFKLTQY